MAVLLAMTDGGTFLSEINEILNARVAIQKASPIYIRLDA